MGKKGNSPVAYKHVLSEAPGPLRLQQKDGRFLLWGVRTRMVRPRLLLGSGTEGRLGCCSPAGVGAEASRENDDTSE